MTDPYRIVQELHPEALFVLERRDLAQLDRDGLFRLRGLESRAQRNRLQRQRDPQPPRLLPNAATRCRTGTRAAGHWHGAAGHVQPAILDNEAPSNS